MLVLTRKTGQSVKIGEDIIVTLVCGKGKQVRLGISAPRAIPVNREEVDQRIKAELAKTE